MPRSMLRFFTHFLRSPTTTGALVPSSRFLAGEIVRHVQLEKARAVIEYGPGTGSFTPVIAGLLPPHARFLAVELNHEFVKLFRQRHPRLSIHHGSVVDIRAICDEHGIDQADGIVSGLPWAIFPDELQNRILDAMMGVLAPGGRFCTFAYLHGLLLPAARRFRRKLDARFSRVMTSKPVWLNLPPAVVYTCVRQEQGP